MCGVCALVASVRGVCGEWSVCDTCVVSVCSVWCAVSFFSVLYFVCVVAVCMVRVVFVCMCHEVSGVCVCVCM